MSMSHSKPPNTLCEAFQRTAAFDPDAVAVRAVGDTQTLTWRQYADRVRRVASGLSALGVRRGDTVALMMANCVEFYPLEVAAQHLGATSFSVYNTMPAQQLGYVLTNSAANVVICQAEYVDRILKSGASFQHLVCVDATVPDSITVDELTGLGSPSFDFDAAWRAVRAEDVLTLIYTSGTTGNPKGVEVTHANLLYEVAAVTALLPVEFGDRITSFLPSAHIADRFTALYLQEVMGTQITVVPDAQHIAAALTDCRPTIWGAVPRVWEKLKAAIESDVATEPDLAVQERMRWALQIAETKVTIQASGAELSNEFAAAYLRAEGLVLSKLRHRLGLDQVKWAISGAAPISPHVLAFFTGLGVPIAEIWGMSELSCIASVVPPSEHQLGTVGRLLPGLEGRIADDGELLVRGPLVMKRYRQEPAKTAEAIDAEGWLHTGDVATISDDGYVTIVDRKKDLIINSAGKNMSPANIENAIKAACPLIGALAAIGDGRPYNTALVALDADAANAHATRSGQVGASVATLSGCPGASAAALASSAAVIARVKAGISAGNAKLARVEQIKRFLIVPEFWEPGGDELTLTMKLRRRSVEQKYASDIDAMYHALPAPVVLQPDATPS
jgi:long-chain acyl-CoA synthetase